MKDSWVWQPVFNPSTESAETGYSWSNLAKQSINNGTAWVHQETVAQY